MDKQGLMERLLNTSRLDRRSFMVGATALGMSAASASTMWSTAAKATPKKGGFMKVGIAGGASSDTLNPATYDATFMITLGNSTRNNVTEVGPDNSLQGALAESWGSSPDAKTWSFKLRKGVEWHNGKSLEPDDIIASLNLHRGPDTKSGAKGVLADIADIKADGKDHVVFTLNNGNADFPFLLTDYHLNIVPAKDGEADWSSGIGTGAYTLEEFKPGISGRVKLFANRWQQDVGFVDEAELLLVSDSNARQNGLTTGALHAINRVNLKTLHLLKQNSNVRVLGVKGRLHHCMAMNSELDPYKSNDIRLALKYAINREEYLKKILYGYGSIGNDNPIGPAYRYHAADIPQRAYDPDKARFHLKKAGVDGLKVDLSAADFLFSGAVDAAVLYRAQAAKAGIDINVVREASDGYYSNVWMVKPWYLSYWGSRATEDLMLSVAYLSSASWNETRVKNERLDKLIVAARAELDESKRAQMYRDAQLLISNEGGIVIPAFADMMHAVSSKVGTSENIGGSWDLDGGHCVKRWWLNA